LKKFKKIYIEITNVCNLKCSFCPETKRPASFMTVKAFDEILEQVKPFTDYIYFHVKGEPFLHPELGQLLDLCFEKRFMVNITTNGTLIKEVTDTIRGKPALRQINFSLHSFEGKQTDERKDEYLNNIFSFIHVAAEKTDVITSLRLWNLDRSRELTSLQNLEILKKIEREFQLPYPLDGEINTVKGIKLAEHVFLNQDYKFEWPALDQEEDFTKGFCYALKTQIGILADGTVVPCCLDGEGILGLGNLCKEPLSDILEGERAKNIRQGFAKKEVVEELCRKCGFRKSFNKKSN